MSTLYFLLDARPVFTNDAVVLGLLMIVLAGIFYTSSLESRGWKKFYTYVPSLLLCYFLPALLNWPLGLIAPHWYEPGVVDLAQSLNLVITPDMSYNDISALFEDNGVKKELYTIYQGHSQLYFMASRYLLPASLLLLCLGIDLKGLINLGPKALIMFGAATLGIIIGGPVALIVASKFMPDVIGANPDELWRGLSTIAGSWIGGGANQAAMKEIYEVKDNLFGTMIVVDVVVANIWMGFLLYGANISDKIDSKLKADNSAITSLKQKISDYRASIEVMPTTTSLFVLMAVAFGGVAVAHLGADIISPFLGQFKETLMQYNLTSLTSGFFWLVVIATTIGLVLSFSKAKKLEGVGASRWGSIFIYVLVATIGMKMNLGEVFKNLGLFAIGIIWMLIHVGILLLVAKIIRAPFFFVAVGSQANIGGAASAPIVASAFSPSLAPVGVLMAVLGYALGTYGALICAQLMALVSGAG
ncbi:MAG: DUF819 family protein [Saprospiraceae bacterium]|nr:DUF819 family protein [Saprospiraceae bacterium]